MKVLNEVNFGNAEANIDFASIRAVEHATGSCDVIQWRALRDYCTANELDFPNIFDPNFGKVRTYPAEAWEAVYGIKLCELF